MLVRIENREGPVQTQADLGLHCLSRPFWQALSVLELLEYLPYLMAVLNVKLLIMLEAYYIYGC